MKHFKIIVALLEFSYFVCIHHVIYLMLISNLKQRCKARTKTFFPHTTQEHTVDMRLQYLSITPVYIPNKLGNSRWSHTSTQIRKYTWIQCFHLMHRPHPRSIIICYNQTLHSVEIKIPYYALFASDCHLSPVSFSLEWFPSLPLAFIALTFLKITGHLTWRISPV